MNLSPQERDRLLLFTAAELARSRRSRGLLLNVPEATALVADAVCEAARAGLRHAEAVEAGRAVLGPHDVLPGVADIVAEVHVEAVFDDGTRLVTVPDPIGGSHLGPEAPGGVTPGPYRDETGLWRDPARPDAQSTRLEVVNEAHVPISVSSHFHFFEVNPRLSFDRSAAYGRHLALPAGSFVRFEPGIPTEVFVVPIGGARVVVGFAGLVDGPLDAPGAFGEALRRLRDCGFADTGATAVSDPSQAVAEVIAARRGGKWQA
jgi:urease subunit gamma/beta